MSTLADELSDLFAPRDGKNLTWRNVNMTLKGEKGAEDRALLSNVWGEVPKKEITAVMGPSGGGKSSILNILSGRTVTKGNLTVDADIRLDNFQVDPSSIEIRKQIAFVAQDDSLQITATPRECIKFSAKLRLPRSITEEQLDSLTSKMLEELGLSHCADTYVGGPLLKGISGGERKRTSVGVELVTKPALVFLDEPTSGLDSYSATKLVELLKKIANAGSSVLFTIHQPSSDLFNSFDHVLLVKQGRVLYSGTALGVPEYFGARSHPMPANYNPSDWIMSVAQQNSVDDLKAKGFFPEDTRDTRASMMLKKGQSMRLSLIDPDEMEVNQVDPRKVSVCTQMAMLFKRDLVNIKRDTTALGTRFGSTVFMGVLFGNIFAGVGNEQFVANTSLPSHAGALTFTVLMNMFGTAQPALFAIPAERPVFLREYSTDHYSVFSYFISKLTMETVMTFAQVLLLNVIVFWLIGFDSNFFLFQLNTFSLAMAATAAAVMLGCAIDDIQQAQEMLPLIFMPQMLFSGFFVTISLIPGFLRWSQWLCSLTYSVRLAMLHEFGDCAKGINVFNPQEQVECIQMLDNYEVNMDTEWLYWLMIFVIFFIFRALGLFILQKKASSFY